MQGYGRGLAVSVEVKILRGANEIMTKRRIMKETLSNNIVHSTVGQVEGLIHQDSEQSGGISGQRRQNFGR